MSQTTQTPPTAAPAEASNRVKLGLSNRLLARPEVGAAVAAIVIFVFFLIVAPAFRSPAAFFTILYQSSTIGIVAVAVGMLMIGGEFDLSAGVAVVTMTPEDRSNSPPIINMPTATATIPIVDDW